MHTNYFEAGEIWCLCRRRMIGFKSVNQSIYIAQRHNVSNALKRRVNTERIKTFLNNVRKHQWKGWDFKVPKSKRRWHDFTQREGLNICKRCCFYLRCGLILWRSTWHHKTWTEPSDLVQWSHCVRRQPLIASRRPDRSPTPSFWRCLLHELAEHAMIFSVKQPDHTTVLVSDSWQVWLIELPSHIP